MGLDQQRGENKKRWINTLSPHIGIVPFRVHSKDSQLLFSMVIQAVFALVLHEKHHWLTCVATWLGSCADKQILGIPLGCINVQFIIQRYGYFKLYKRGIDYWQIEQNTNPLIKWA